MNHFLLSPEERLRHWRDFRNTLEPLSGQEQLQKVISYWAKCPIHATMILDPYDPRGWMTPWEILNYGQFCRNTISYMMEQTLLLMANGHWNDRTALKLLKDDYLSDIILAVIIDDKIVLNYNYNSIVMLSKIEQNFKILCQYKYDSSSKKHIEY
jgi:hypothetical protein